MQCQFFLGQSLDARNRGNLHFEAGKARTIDSSGVRTSLRHWFRNNGRATFLEASLSHMNDGLTLAIQSHPFVSSTYLGL